MVNIQIYGIEVDWICNNTIHRLYTYTCWRALWLLKIYSHLIHGERWWKYRGWRSRGPLPPAPCLGNWGNADLRCHCPELCTGLHWILQNCMLCKIYSNMWSWYIWQPTCDWSTALQIALGPHQNKKNQFGLQSMVHGGELGQIVSAGARCTSTGSAFWRNLNPSCPRGCWLAQVLQTNSDSFDPKGRHNNPPDSSKEWSVAWLTPKPHHFNLDQQRQWWWTGSCGDFGAWYCITEKARVTWQGRPILVLHSNSTSSSSSRREVLLVVMFP